ncbi:MAG: DUF6152 family protein [Rhodospirillaceae bacterium]|nr:DUF6152 family protein [Rhodospirillaceae bacterium]
MKRRLKRSGAAVALLLLTLPAAAHHSRAIYDQERIVTMAGTVTRYEWTNPHIYLYIEAPDDAGDRVEWELEGNVTTIMRRLGWSRETLVPGDAVTVHVNPARDAGRAMALIHSVEKAGVTLFANSASLEARPPLRADSLAGIWEIPVTPWIRQFSEPTSWSVTAAGAEGVAAYDDRTMNPQLQCTPRTAPWLMIFTGVQQIDLGDSTISIRTEYDTVERTVHMDVGSHDGAAVTHQGHSIGRWEGDVLVVDTTHFADHRSGNARGIRSGSQKHLIERFELSADRTSLIYRFELEDPEYLAAPVTGELRAAYRPDLDFVQIACDPETAGRFAED